MILKRRRKIVFLFEENARINNEKIKYNKTGAGTTQTTKITPKKKRRKKKNGMEEKEIDEEKRKRATKAKKNKNSVNERQKKEKNAKKSSGLLLVSNMDGHVQEQLRAVRKHFTAHLALELVLGVLHRKFRQFVQRTRFQRFLLHQHRRR